MEQAMLKDFFGTPALDYGSYEAMQRKYRDNCFIMVTNQPPPDLGDGYVLEIGEPGDEAAMEERSLAYYNKMRAAGNLACCTGVVKGAGIIDKMLDGFIGGIGV